MKTFPQFLKPHFWDVDCTRLDCSKHARFIIDRLLECGDETALAWLMRQYPRSRIVQTLKKSRQLTPPSAGFWSLILGVPRKEILCLTKSFQATRKKFWAA